MQIYVTETNAAREPGRLFFLMSLISASAFAAYSSWIKQPLLTQHFLLLHRVAFIVKKQKQNNPQEKIMFF